MNRTTAPLRQTSFTLEQTAQTILDIQLPSGEIPWHIGGKTDPWDHIEAAMGLCVAGYVPEARKAYLWLAENQLADGSWYAAYRNGVPEDLTREANHAAYISVGLLQYLLITHDMGFVKKLWPTLRSALDFVVGLQAPGGEIHWAISPEDRVDPMALLTGSCSIYQSLKCGLFIAHRLGYALSRWEKALQQLETAIRTKPHHFNMTKSRFSMDWFYPILCGALTGYDAQQRIHRHWKKFVVEGQGVKCVSDQPWVTIAESAEFCLALHAMGNHRLSEIVFSWIVEKRDDDGGYWCGYTYPDMTIWPEERMSWTNGVVLMAADAVYGLTTAARLFDHGWWNDRLPCEKTIAPMH